MVKEALPLQVLNELERIVLYMDGTRYVLSTSILTYFG